jgi:hypothetical protein
MWRCAGFIKPATQTDVATAKYPESLCPSLVLPPLGRRAPPPPRILLLVLRSYGLMRQSRWPSPPSVLHLVPGVFAGCYQPLLPTASSRLYLCKSFPRCLAPCPDGSHRVLLPVSSPMSSAFPKTLMGRLPVRSANATFPRASCRGCRHFFMFRPLSLLASQIAPTAASFPTGQPRLLHPGISCFVASARSGYAIRPIQVIDGEGTCTLPDLQPCRLLQCLTNRTVNWFQPPPHRT